MAKRGNESSGESRDDVKIQEQINALLKNRADLLSQIKQKTNEIALMVGDEKENSNEYAKSLETRKALIAQLISYQDELNDLTSDQSDVSDKVAESFEAQSDWLSSINTSLFNISDKSQKVLKLNTLIAGSMQISNDLVGDMNTLAQSNTVEVQAQRTLFQSTLSIVNDLAESSTAVAKAYDAGGIVGFSDAMSGTVDLAADQKRIASQTELIEKHKSQLTDDQYNKLKDALGIAKDNLDILTKQKDVIAKASELGSEVQNKVQAGFDKMSGMLSNIPGGDFLMKHFGLDKISGEISNKIGGAMSEAFASASTAGGGMFTSLGAGVKAFGMALITGPQAIIFGTLALVALMAKLFMDADSAVMAMGDSLDLSHTQAVKIYDSATDISNEMNLVAINAAEVGAAIGEMNDELPGFTQAIAAGNEHAMGLAKSASMMKTSFGLTGEEIGNMNAIATMTGTSVEEIAAQAGIMGKNTIGTKEAMKALASVPRGVTAAFKGSVGELTKAAIKAKALGTDLGKIQSIGDGMLDIESSLNDEMEARVITGKDINLDKARQLALDGDISGLQDELLNQMGSQAEFQSMNRLGQEAMAKAMGMSVDEMSSMLTKAEELKNIGMDQKQLDAMSVEAMRDMANMSDGAKKDALLKLAKEKESATIAEKFGNVMEKVQQTAMKLVTPLLEMVHSFFDAGEQATGFGKTLSAIGSVFGVIGKLIGAVLAPAFDMLTAPFSFIFDMLGSIIKIFSGDFAGGLNDLGKTMMDFFLKIPEMVVSSLAGIFDAIFGTDLKSSVTDFFDGIKDAFGKVMQIFVPVFDGIMSALTPIFDVFKGIFKDISSLFSGMFSGAEEESGGFMESLSGIFGAITTAFEFIKPALVMIGTLIGDLIATPFKLIGNLVGGIVKMFKGDMAGGLKQIGGGILDNILAPFKFVIGIFDTIVGLFNSFSESLGPVGQSIMDYILAPFNFIKTLIDGIILMFTDGFMVGLQKIGGGIQDLVMAPIKAIGGVVSGVMGLFGGDDEEATKSADAAKTSAGGATVIPIEGAATGGRTTSEGLAIVGEKGPEIVALPQSAKIANTSVSEQAASVLGGQQPTGGEDGKKLDTIISILSSIATQVSTPANITIGDKVINEMNSILKMKKNATLGLDNQYGVTAA